MRDSVPSPRPMTPAEHAQGYAVCDCGRFAHAWRASVLKRLPRDYHGELCPVCSLWVCSVTLLQQGMKDDISE